MQNKFLQPIKFRKNANQNKESNMNSKKLSWATDLVEIGILDNQTP